MTPSKAPVRRSATRSGFWNPIESSLTSLDSTTPRPSSTQACSEPPDEPNPNHALPTDEERIYHSTEPNRFGVFRQYEVFTLVDPEVYQSADSCIDSPCISKSVDPKDDPQSCSSLRCFGSRIAKTFRKKIYTPLKNYSSYLILSWFYNGTTTKSAGDLDNLVQNVLLHPKFKKEELQGFRTMTELEKLDGHDPTSDTLTPENGWIKTSVEIPLPKEGHKYPSEQDALTFKVEGLYYRPLLSIIKEAVSSPSSKAWHWSSSSGSLPLNISPRNRILIKTIPLRKTPLLLTTPQSLDPRQPIPLFPQRLNGYSSKSIPLMPCLQSIGLSTHVLGKRTTN